MSEPIYFAGGFYYPAEKKKDRYGEIHTVPITTKPKEFGLVHGCFRHSIPYLTHNPNGLKLTVHHSNLYRLSDDMKTAKMVRYTCPAAAPHIYDERGPFPESTVYLSEDQIAKIKRAIDANYFYD